METRANYFLIGLFTLLSILAAFGFFLWFARIEITRQFDYYDVILDSASGLGRAGDVRFNGILVGRVIDLAFVRDDPGLVRVRIEVAADTPIKTDTVARLESQGVTGVSYIGLIGGSTTAAPLEAEEQGRVPVITAERSSVQAILEDAPDLLAEAIVLLRELRAFAGEANRAHVANILENADRASGGLGAALEDFSRISETVRAARAGRDRADRGLHGAARSDRGQCQHCADARRHDPCRCQRRHGCGAIGICHRRRADRGAW